MTHRQAAPIVRLGLLLLAAACRPDDPGEADGTGGSSGTEGPCVAESEPPRCAGDNDVTLERCESGVWVGERCDDLCMASTSMCAIGCVSHAGTSACLCADDPALCPGQATCAGPLSLEQTDGTRVLCNNVCAALPATPLTAGCQRDAAENVDRCICVADGDPCEAGEHEFCAGAVDEDAFIPPPVPDIVTCQSGVWAVESCADRCVTAPLGCYVDAEHGGVCVCEDP